MRVPSIPYYENVNSKICDAQFQKGSDMCPRIYSQKCFSGSSAEVSPCEDSEIFWDNKAPHKPEMMVGADHVLNSSKRHSFSCHNLQNHQLIPTNDNARIPDPQIPDPQMWNLFRDSTFSSPKSKPVILPSQARSAFSSADRRTPPSPVVISLELLDSLHGMSLPLAASTVGVSPTAFKRACRRLGVPRWEYRRGPGRARSKNVAGPTGPVATSQHGSSAGEDVDMQLAGVGTADCETKELADWLRGEVAEVGRAVMAEPEDDALVLQMLALRWPVTTAVPALD